MKISYYQLTERADSTTSIGVIAYEDGIFDVGNIKKAIESHFDESISDVKINYSDISWDRSFEISFQIEDRVEIIDAVQTWIYF